MVEPRLSGPLLDATRALAIAEAAIDRVFGRNYYDLLIAAVPDEQTSERYAFVSRLNFRQLRSQVARFRSPSALGHWLRQEASMDEAIAVAWGLANVIGQCDECRINDGTETALTRYSDILAHPNSVQLCLFGLDYLIFVWD